ARPLPGARPQVLGRDPCAHSGPSARRRGRQRRRAADAVLGRAIGYALTGRPRTRAWVTRRASSRTGAVQGIPLIDAAAEPYVVIMHHQREADRQALAVALASQARYIGLLGP